MSIDEKCSELVGRVLPEFTYVFSDWYDGDRLVSKLPLPIVMRILPVGGTMTLRNGRVWDAENGAIAFIDKVPKDATGEENAERYDAMKEAAKVFLSEAVREGLIEPLTNNVTYQVIYEQLSTIVTGVMLDIVLRDEPVCG